MPRIEPDILRMACSTTQICVCTLAALILAEVVKDIFAAVVGLQFVIETYVLQVDDFRFVFVTDLLSFSLVPVSVV